MVGSSDSELYMSFGVLSCGLIRIISDMFLIVLHCVL